METAYSQALAGVLDGLKLGSGVLPLNRLETGNWELLASLRKLGNSSALEELRDRFRDLTGRRHIFFAPSCRAAMAQVLALLPQEEVVMPAYTCAVVRLAAQIAGKRILYTDVAQGSVNSTSREFEPYARPGRILIPTHLFGIPTDIEKICQLARQKGCVTIEDAAASIVERCGSGAVGTFGDVGIFSFERSKRLPAFRGAVIVLNNEGLIEPEKLAQADMFGAERKPPLWEIISSMAYNIAGTPWIYGKFVVPRQLRKYARWKPSTGNNRAAATGKPFKREFHAYQAMLVLRMLDRIETIRKRIAEITAVYLEELRGSPVITFLPGQYSDSTLLRFPIAIPGMKRTQFLRRALERGLFLETNYEGLLATDISAGELANAQWVADNVVLLPLYSILSDRQARRIAREVLRVASERSLGSVGE